MCSEAMQATSGGLRCCCPPLQNFPELTPGQKVHRCLGTAHSREEGAVGAGEGQGQKAGSGESLARAFPGSRRDLAAQ